MPESAEHSGEEVTAAEREPSMLSRPLAEVEAEWERMAEPTYVALRGSGDQPDLAATGRPVVGVCSTHDQGCCAGCPTLGCRFCRCRREPDACEHHRKDSDRDITAGPPHRITVERVDRRLWRFELRTAGGALLDYSMGSDVDLVLGHAGRYEEDRGR